MGANGDGDLRRAFALDPSLREDFTANIEGARRIAAERRQSNAIIATADVAMRQWRSAPNSQHEGLELHAAIRAHPP